MLKTIYCFNRDNFSQAEQVNIGKPKGQGRLRTIGKPKSTVMIILLQAETRQAQKLSDPCVYEPLLHFIQISKHGISNFT